MSLCNRGPGPALDPGPRRQKLFAYSFGCLRPPDPAAVGIDVDVGGGATADERALSPRGSTRRIVRGGGDFGPGGRRLPGRQERCERRTVEACQAVLLSPAPPPLLRGGAVVTDAFRGQDAPDDPALRVHRVRKGLEQVGKGTPDVSPFREFLYRTNQTTSRCEPLIADDLCAEWKRCNYVHVEVPAPVPLPHRNEAQPAAGPLASPPKPLAEPGPDRHERALGLAAPALRVGSEGHEDNAPGSSEDG